jgi:hypothetical protein
MAPVAGSEWKIEGPKRAIKVRHRPPESFMGRFGGGWQLEVGVQASRRSVIVNCLVFSVRFDRKTRETR